MPDLTGHDAAYALPASGKRGCFVSPQSSLYRAAENMIAYMNETDETIPWTVAEMAAGRYIKDDQGRGMIHHTV